MFARIFIGSSSKPERMLITNAIGYELEMLLRIIPRPWPHVFPLGSNTLESLLREVTIADFAIFVLGPDDRLLKERPLHAEGQKVEGERSVPRDNVIFEMGLFMGKLGKERCWAILPEDHTDLHIFTDFVGMNYRTYRSSSSPSLNAMEVIRLACGYIAEEIRKLKPLPIHELQAFFGTQPQAVAVYPDIVVGKVQNYRRFPPLVSLETRVHSSSNGSQFRSEWWYNEKYPRSSFQDPGLRVREALVPDDDSGYSLDQERTKVVERLCKDFETYGLAFRTYSTPGQSPSEAGLREQIVIARVRGSLQFRVFDREGELILSLPESRIPAHIGAMSGLRKRLRQVDFSNPPGPDKLNDIRRSFIEVVRTFHECETKLKACVSEIQENDVDEIAHFHDVRAVNCIAELCGRMGTNLLTTRDGQEQDVIQALRTISFSIGLANGLTHQAFEIIERETSGKIRMVFTQYLRRTNPGETGSVFEVNGNRYPRLEPVNLMPEIWQEDRSLPGGYYEDANHYAIIVRTFLRQSLEGGESVLRFVVGGCVAAGTAVAGYFLKYHWRDLLYLYETQKRDIERDSLAVVIHFHSYKVESSKPHIIEGAFFNNKGMYEKFTF